MASSSNMSASAFCFKVFGTCLILAPALGIWSAASGNRDAASFALLALAVAGVSLVCGLIASIWGQ